MRDVDAQNAVGRLLGGSRVRNANVAVGEVGGRRVSQPNRSISEYAA